MRSDYQKRAGGDLPTTIRAIRLAKGLSQPEFGLLLNRGGIRVSRWEVGAENPSLDVLFKLLTLAESETQRTIVSRAIEAGGLQLSAIAAALAQMLPITPLTESSIHDGRGGPQ
jgi:transcriptional regulator with XRE-family HTH domain